MCLGPYLLCPKGLLNQYPHKLIKETITDQQAFLFSLEVSDLSMGNKLPTYLICTILKMLECGCWHYGLTEC